MLLVVAAVLTVAWLSYSYWKFVNKHIIIEDMFPGPPTIPFLGNTHQFYGDTHGIHEGAIFQGNKYRRSFRTWIGPVPFIVLQKPADVEAVLNNTTDIKKARLYDFIIPWVKRGLLTSYGDKWKRQRKLLTPAFHFKILDGFLEIFHRNSLGMCKIIDKKVGSNFNIFDVMKMCALDNISETAMGVTINAQDNPNSEYVEAVKMMCHIIFLRTMRPWYRPDFIFNLTYWGAKQRECLNTLHGYSEKIIDRRIAERQNGNGTVANNSAEEEYGIKNKKAFLDLMLDNYDSGLMTKEEIHEEVDTFMFEGHDTITSALSFAMYNLANHPEIQQKVYEEQEEIFGKDCTGGLATVDNLNQMKYLEMVIKESLRLCPSVPAFGRVVERDVKLDDFTYIPSGMEALVITPALHRNPDVWDRPHDFDPDRFLPENVAKRHPYSFIPFSAGPRNCIGMRFAMMEMKATLSNVVRKFKLKPSSAGHTLELAMEVVLLSRNGAHISVERRNKQE